MKSEIASLLGSPPEKWSDDRVISFSSATSERATKWQTETLTWPAFAKRLTHHRVGAKEGCAITPATFDGASRSGRGALEVQVAVLDSDKGAPFGEIVSRLKGLEYKAAIATSHSHLTTNLKVSRKVWEKWLLAEQDHSPERFLLAQGFWPAIASGAYLSESFGDDAASIYIGHQACPKVRIFIPVRTAWTASRGASAYRAGLETLARSIGINADPSGMEPAHLFFEPRYRRGGPQPESAVLEGKLADPWGESSREGPSSIMGEVKQRAAQANAGEDELTGLSREHRRKQISMDPAVFASAVMAIRNDERFDGFPEFLRVLGGIGVETQKSEQGWELASRWIESRVSGNNDPVRSREYWDRLRLPAAPEDATGATILYLARQDGWTLPSRPPLSFGDLEMGVIFASEARGRLVYVSASNDWLRWQANVYSKITTPDIEAIAKDIARRMHVVASERYRDSPGDASKSAMNRANRYVDSIDRARKIIEAGRSENGVSVPSYAEFDQDKMVVGVLNGAINLRSGDHFLPSPQDRLTKQLKTKYRRDAACPAYLEFLTRIQPEPDVRIFLQRWVGYLLTGQIGELKWLFCYGTGANGKTAFVNLVSSLLGDYVFHADSSLLTRNKHENEAARQIAQLPGKRLISANETARGDVFDDERMKRLVSQEPISARFLHREAFNFEPTGKLMLQGNHRPIVQDDSNGFWRRMILVEFPVQLSQQEIVKDIDKLIFARESEGILNWAIQGCLDWQATGLSPPASLEKDKEEYKAESDTLGQWIEQNSQTGAGLSTYLDEAYRSYVDHHKSQGLSPMTQPTFTRAMKARGFPKGGSKGRPKLLEIRVSRSSDHFGFDAYSLL